MDTLHFEARDTFSVPPEALWPLLADTARLNRALGMPPIEYTITPLDGGGSQVEAVVRVFGYPIARYTEHPYQWEAPHRYAVFREFHGGALEHIRVGAQLIPTDGGTEVRFSGDFLPRNRVGVMFARWLGPRGVRNVIHQCRLFERYLLGQAAHPFPQLIKRASLPEPAERATAELARGASDERAVELLRRHLAEAPDEDVVKMRPFELADRWGLDRRETLALFLRATTAGLVSLSWDVLCPNCRVGKAEYSSLRDLTGTAHCETCNITFDAAFDRSVEVRFGIAPTLRRVESQEFCMGGPMHRPHVLAQAELAPGQAASLACTLAPGAYRLRSSASRGRCMLDILAADPTPAGAAGPAMLAVQVSDEAFEPVTAELPAGPIDLQLDNATDRLQIVVLEGSLWPDTVVTAALVSTLQEFRDLFSSEVLSPGLQLGIEKLAFMFTDLTGSTALYQAIGQARAFRLVQDHFRVLVAAIAANDGAQVKTIGDAVMAVFPGGTNALAAALQIQRDMRLMQAPAEVDTSQLVKIGLHEGPCLAVTLNDRLDYFGTIVNTTARIEHESRGGQIVASGTVCQSESAARLLDESGALVEQELVRLRGIDEPVSVYRITPIQVE